MNERALQWLLLNACSSAGAHTDRREKEGLIKRWRQLMFRATSGFLGNWISDRGIVYHRAHVRSLIFKLASQISRLIIAVSSSGILSQTFDDEEKHLVIHWSGCVETPWWDSRRALGRERFRHDLRIFVEKFFQFTIFSSAIIHFTLRSFFLPRKPLTTCLIIANYNWLGCCSFNWACWGNSPKTRDVLKRFNQNHQRDALSFTINHKNIKTNSSLPGNFAW